MPIRIKFFCMGSGAIRGTVIGTRPDIAWPRTSSHSTSVRAVRLKPRSALLLNDLKIYPLRYGAALLIRQGIINDDLQGILSRPECGTKLNRTAGHQPFQICLFGGIKWHLFTSENYLAVTHQPHLSCQLGLIGSFVQLRIEDHVGVL